MINKGENKRLKRKVRNSYITSTVSIALVLFLLGSVGYLILNALRTTRMMQESMVMYVMLDDGIEPETERSVGEKFKSLPAVKEAVFVSKQQAAEDFKDYVGEDFEEFLEFNPLPDSYEVRLKAENSDKESIKEVDKQISSWNGVDEVVYQKGVAEQITENINKFNIIVLAFGGALLIISLILLNNTIRVSIFSKRYVINTMKQVGASRWFIMKPFLGSSLKQGIAAGVIATLMFMGLIVALNQSIPDVMVLAGNMPVVIIVCVMMGLGILISVLFTTFALNKFINMNTSKIYLY